MASLMIAAFYQSLTKRKVYIRGFIKKNSFINGRFGDFEAWCKNKKRPRNDLLKNRLGPLIQVYLLCKDSSKRFLSLRFWAKVFFYR